MAARKSIDLASARVLLSNDDGIDAEGLKVLEEIVRPLVGELWVSAPAEGHSGASAMVSLRREVSVEARGERRFAVTGRPADSLLAALRLTMADNPPDLVLSGINHGANIGGDLIYSGTVGVAVSASLNGVPAIAFSADYDGTKTVTPETWAEVRAHLPSVLERICRFGFAERSVFGVNFPIETADPNPVLCRQGDSGDTMIFLPVDGKNGAYTLSHEGDAPGSLDGTDLGALAAGRIGITPITLDRTDREILHQAAEAL